MENCDVMLVAVRKVILENGKKLTIFSYSKLSNCSEITAALFLHYVYCSSLVSDSSFCLISSINYLYTFDVIV